MKSMRWLSLTCGLSASLLAGQETDLVLRAGVSLVRVDAQVLQADKVISDLSQDDFQVKDNGVPQKILYFGREEDAVDLVLLLDTSGSMKAAIEEVNQAANEALGQLKDGDRVAVSRFTLRYRLVQPLTEDRAAIGKVIDSICSQPFRGGTNIHHALQAVGDYLTGQRREARRRAVLIISDGVSPKSSREISVLKKIWEADAVLHALLVKPPGYTLLLRPPFGRVSLPELAEKTGGSVIRAHQAGEGFRQIIDRIRRRYSLHYALPAGTQGEHRKLSVELANPAKRRVPGARVYARKGYTWSAPSASGS